MIRRVFNLARKALVFAQSRWKTRNCSQVGAWVRVEGGLVVGNFGQITLGERVRIRGTHVPVELAAMEGGVLRIGARTFINSGTSICAEKSVTIGSNCAIGNYVLIMDTDFHAVGDHSAPGKTGAVTIEDDAWIGARATVLKGVTVGRGAVVAAGAVVTKNVPARTLVAGVPARVIREL